MDLLPSQLHPIALSGFSAQEFNGSLTFAFAIFVATMVVVKHDQIESLLADVAFATVQRGADEGMDHFDQRRGSDNRVELLNHQGFERFKRLVEVPCGASQPLVSFSLMGTLLCGLRWIAEMIMVPSQHQSISGMWWHDLKELRIDRFALLKRD
jgi:hypothetical protein